MEEEEEEEESGAGDGDEVEGFIGESVSRLEAGNTSEIDFLGTEF